MSSDRCKHPVLYLENADEFGALTSCLFCNRAIPISQQSLRDWILFDSQEAASYDARRLHLERDTILVRRSLIS